MARRPWGQQKRRRAGYFLVVLVLVVASMRKERGQKGPLHIDVPRAEPAPATPVPSVIPPSPAARKVEAESRPAQIATPPHSAKPVPQAEWHIFLPMANRIAPRLVSNRAAFDRMAGASTAERVAVERGLEEAGELQVIANGSAALVREKWDGSRLVELVGGRLNGKRGWVEERHVREAPPPSIIDQAHRRATTFISF